MIVGKIAGTVVCTRKEENLVGMKFLIVQKHTVDGKPTADFILFTPKAERPDPCDEMRQMMQKRK